jgi:hypothetical protein
MRLSDYRDAWFEASLVAAVLVAMVWLVSRGPLSVFAQTIIGQEESGPEPDEAAPPDSTIGPEPMEVTR